MARSIEEVRADLQTRHEAHREFALIGGYVIPQPEEQLALVVLAEGAFASGVEHVVYRCAPCMNCGGQAVAVLHKQNHWNWLYGGELVQAAFPFMAADDRETLISGTHAACWQQTMGPEDPTEYDEFGRPAKGFCDWCEDSVVYEPDGDWDGEKYVDCGVWISEGHGAECPVNVTGAKHEIRLV